MHDLSFAGLPTNPPAFFLQIFLKWDTNEQIKQAAYKSNSITQNSYSTAVIKHIGLLPHSDLKILW